MKRGNAYDKLTWEKTPMTKPKMEELKRLLRQCEELAREAGQELISHEGAGTPSNLLIRQLEQLAISAREAYRIV